MLLERFSLGGSVIKRRAHDNSSQSQSHIPLIPGPELLLRFLLSISAFDFYLLPAVIFIHIGYVFGGQCRYFYF